MKKLHAIFFASSMILGSSLIYAQTVWNSQQLSQLDSAETLFKSGKQKDALKIYDNLGKEVNPEAYILAGGLLEKSGQLKDAAKWYEKAMKKGSEQGKFLFGRAYISEGKQIEKGLQLIESAANNGNGDALFYLAENVEAGTIPGLPQNNEKARQHLKKAALTGHKTALHRLKGNLPSYGDEEMIEALTILSEVGKDEECGIYLAGIFFDKDRKEDAIRVLGGFNSSNAMKIKDFMTTSHKADFNDKDALFDLAGYYKESAPEMKVSPNLTVISDAGEYKRLLRKSANLGNKNALPPLKDQFIKEKNYEEAINVLYNMHTNGQPGMFTEIGLIYFNNLKDYPSALAWFQDAKEQGENVEVTTKFVNDDIYRMTVQLPNGTTKSMIYRQSEKGAAIPWEQLNRDNIKNLIANHIQANLIKNLSFIEEAVKPQYLKEVKYEWGDSGWELDNSKLFIPDDFVFNDNGLLIDLRPYIPKSSDNTAFFITIPYEQLMPYLTKEEVTVIGPRLINLFKQEVGNLSDKRIRELWEGIPDHGMNDLSEVYLSKNFFDLANIGFLVPTDNPGGIGSEDFMYYWYRGQDWDINDKITSIKVTSQSDNTATATITYKSFDEVSPYKVKFIKEKIVYPSGVVAEKWVIDDFEGLRAEIFDYINDIGVKFTKGFENEVMREMESQGYPLNSDEKRDYLKTVETFKKAFKETYPNGVVRP